MVNYSCKKVFSYDLNLSHNTFVTNGVIDGRTDRRRVDDNHANSSTVT